MAKGTFNPYVVTVSKITRDDVKNMAVNKEINCF